MKSAARIISTLLVVVLWIGCLCSHSEAKPSGEPYTYTGCYRDAAHRDMSRHAATFHMSPERCFRECSILGYRYFGLQYSAYCFCGNVYGMYGKVDDRECNMRCDGNIAEWCGSGWKNSVFRINRKN